jgi:hypothetical protein
MVTDDLKPGIAAAASGRIEAPAAELIDKHRHDLDDLAREGWDRFGCDQREPGTSAPQANTVTSPECQAHSESGFALRIANHYPDWSLKSWQEGLSGTRYAQDRHGSLQDLHA